VHSVAEAGGLDPDLVDYAVAGPAFATASKPGYGPVLGAAGIAAMSRASKVPIIAIGGVEAANVAEVLDAGASGVAVMGGVMRSPEPENEVKRLLAALRAR
jgi:thiamine-phosphate pyrophosphorylase